MKEKKFSRRRAMRAGVSGLALALVAGILPTALAGPAVAQTASAYVDSKGNPVTVEQLRQAGNDTVAFLYEGAAADVPRPADMDIWPSGDVYDSFNIQPATPIADGEVGMCAVTMMGQSQGFNIVRTSPTAVGSYRDVTRDFAQTTPLVAQTRYDQQPQFDNGYMLTRPAATADAADALTESGRVQVVGADAGYFTLAMDGWGDHYYVNTAIGEMNQSSRLRIATAEDVNNFRLVLRLDSVTDVDHSVTAMNNWTGWWAPGYTQAPSANFTVTYEVSNGVTYAIVEATTIPADTWATITFHGRVPADAYVAGGQLFSWSAATASFPNLGCEMPTPRWDETSHFPGASVSLPNVGDVIPQGTTPAETTVAAASIDWATTTGTTTGEVSIDAATGVLTTEVPADAVPGKYTVPVTITYGDGTSQIVDVIINVLPVAAYLDTTVNQGETATVAAPLDQAGNAMPEGTTYAPGTDVPAWATVNADGTITVSPDATVPAGVYEVPVVVTLPSGEVTTVIAKVTVVNPNAPAYENGTVKQSETITIPTPANPDGSAPPEGTTYAPGDNVPSWVAVNEDGTLTASPGTNVAPGDYSVNVLVNYPDGSTATITAVITVVAPVPQVGTDPATTASVAPAAGGSSLASTGADASGLVWFAAPIAFAGAALLFTARRRGQRDHN